MPDAKQNKLDGFSRRSEKADALSEIGLKLAEATMPILNAVREEEQHALGLVDSIIDKLLDTAKLLIGISFPALVTLYSLKSSSFNPGRFIFLTFIILLVGVLIFLFGMRYKMSHLTPYLEASSGRLELYTELTKTALFSAKNKNLKLEHHKISKQKRFRP